MKSEGLSSRTLYLRISDTQLCFARANGSTPDSISVSRFPMNMGVSLKVNLRNAMMQEEILQSPAEKVEVFVSGPTTAVPLAEFEEEDCETLFKACFREQEGMKVFYDTLPGTDVALLFALEDAACRSLAETFPNVYYRSALTSLLRHFATTRAAFPTERRAFLYLYEDKLCLSVFEGARLLTLCEYEAPTANDVAYYALAATKVLGIRPEREPFYLAGEPSKRTEAASLLNRFVSSVNEIDPASEFANLPLAANADVPYDLITMIGSL